MANWRNEAKCAPLWRRRAAAAAWRRALDERATEIYPSCCRSRFRQAGRGGERASERAQEEWEAQWAGRPQWAGPAESCQPASQPASLPLRASLSRWRPAGRPIHHRRLAPSDNDQLTKSHPRKGPPSAPNGLRACPASRTCRSGRHSRRSAGWLAGPSESQPKPLIRFNLNLN